MGYKLAMYDIRGIQKYVFRTPELKSAIGASALVDGIISEALETAVDEYRKAGNDIKDDLEWFEVGIGPKEYHEDAFDVQVLYIGGGNAFVVYKDNEAMISTIHKAMSRYVLQKTYSLQLAIAVVPKTDDFQSDQKKVRTEMESIKQRLPMTAPLGAIPIVKVDMKTGFPIVDRTGNYTTESLQKKRAAEKKRRYHTKEEKLIDSLRTKKRIDSTVAVVHIDGNNLGLRIQALIADKISYQEGVKAERFLSYQIDSSYKMVFDQMTDYIERNAVLSKDLKEKENNIYIIPVVRAGDDITYVCNGRVAFESVSYFAKAISELSMSTEDDSAVRQKYSFSICAGIAFVNSHFPFHVAYNVAEECCENAKAEAKKTENLQDWLIGNWVDFHICKNIQARNLRELRKREYVTCMREQLLTRPYYIPTEKEIEESVFGKLAKADNSLLELQKNVRFFNNAKKIPSSFAKQLRNLYPLGEPEVEQYASFLKSRNKVMPDNGFEMYVTEGEKKRAKWYDALEVMDLYAEMKGEIENGEISAEN